MTVHRILSSLLLSIVALASGSLGEPADLLRQASAAYSRGDFDAAIDFCKRAEDRTEDPGLVAFNKAAALYRVGDFRLAELHYRRCLEDANNARLARALYDLGNCLVKKSEGRDKAWLSEAIDSYERCLALPDNEPTLVLDARYNLELAKVLLKNAKTGASHQPDSYASTEKDQSSKSSQGQAPPQPNEQGQEGARVETQTTDASGQISNKQSLNELPRPGKGNLTPIPDEPDRPVLSLDEANEKLKKAVERIMNERRAHRRQSARGLPANVKDW